jgi:hypothetical protein
MIGFRVLITSAGSAPRRLRSSWASRCRIFFSAVRLASAIHGDLELSVS